MLVSSISVGRKRKALSEMKSEAPVLLLEVSLLAAVDASLEVEGGEWDDGTTKATMVPEERPRRSAGKTRGKTLMVAVGIHSKDMRYARRVISASEHALL